MKKIYLFIGLALSMLAGGCSKDDSGDNPVVPGGKDDVTVKVTATIAEEGILWSEGATVAINGFESSALAAGGEAVATFEIKNVSAPLKVVAPFKAYGAGDIVTIPDTQKYVAGGYDADAFVMYGYAAKFVETEASEETEENKTAAAEVEMHAACGIVKLPVVLADGSATISSISLTAANDEAVAGQWKFDFTNGSATVEKAFSTVALDCGENGVALGASAVDFSFVIPAAAYAKGVIIEAATTDGHKFVCDYKDALTVAAGAEVALETMNFEIIEKADATLNITIAEPAITWTAGDEVVVNGVLSSAVADADAGKSTASFELKEVAHPYTVLYPRELYTSSGRLRFYDEQRLLKNEFDREALAMVGYSFGSDVTLHNVCGLIKIPVFNNFEGEVVTLEKVCIRSNDGSPLAGKYNINYRNATLSLVSAVDTMTLVPEEGSKGIEIPIGEKIYVYAIVPEGRFPAGLTIDVYTDVENQMDILCTPAGGLNVTRGVETELETVEYTDVKIEAITTAEELVEFAKCVNNGRYKKFINSEGEVVLGGDIDMSGVEWTAITGPENAGFDGIFNGQGYAIKNWKTDGTALFAQIDAGAVVKNIVIDASCEMNVSTTNAGNKGFIANYNLGTVSDCVNNAPIVLEIETATAQYMIGAIVGLSGSKSEALVTNCINNGGVTIKIGSMTASSYYFGGVVGDTSGKADTVCMSNCINNGDITVNIDGADGWKNVYLGGCSGAGNSDGVISDCTNNGKVDFYLDKANSGAYPNIGGITGYAATHINGCKNTGDVSIRTNTAKAGGSPQITRPAIGGIAGYANGDVTGCENHGHIFLQGTADVRFAGTTATGGGVGSMGHPVIGGVCGSVGYPKEIATSQKNRTISDCHNYGLVELINPSGSTWVPIGGVVGFPTGTIKDCTNEKSGVVKVTMGGAQTYCGGVYGATVMATKNTITNCHNYGKVWFADSTVATTDSFKNTTRSYVGGVSGGYGSSSSSNNATNCTNEGEIIAEATQTMIVAGVLAAHNGTITDCVNKGSITVKNAFALADGVSEVGGIVGYVNGDLTNCSSYGTITNNSDAGTDTGAILGAQGGAKTVKGGVIDCTIVAPDSNVGIILGSTRKAANAVTLGAADAPIVISTKTTINGVAVTAADAADAAKLAGILRAGSLTITNVVVE